MSHKAGKVHCKICKVLRFCKCFAFIVCISASISATLAEVNALLENQKSTIGERDQKRDDFFKVNKMLEYGDGNPKTTRALNKNTSKSPFAEEGIEDRFPESTSLPLLLLTDESKINRNSKNFSFAFHNERLEYLFDGEEDLDKTVYVIPGVLFDTEQEEKVLGGPAKKKPPIVDGFVWEQKMELLRLHNMYRRNASPPASDMFFMEWDEELSDVAQQWSKTCHFDHGLPDDYEGNPLGQNLYMGWDHTGVRAMFRWYEEYHDFELKTLYCVPGKQCGHYTQMMWADSKLLGCGMSKCGHGNFYVVCHYYPPGNIQDTPPYQVGKPCSQCNSVDGGLCNNNLCVTHEQCKRNENTCSPSCPLECHNCGGLNKTACRCICSEGWDSLDCTKLCVNEHGMCGKTPGFPTVATCAMHKNAVRNKYCRKMCGACRGFSEEHREKDSCCAGLECDDGYVIDLERRLCNCRLLCPGPKCYEFTEKEHSEETSTGVRHFSLSISVLILLFIEMNWFLSLVS